MSQIDEVTKSQTALSVTVQEVTKNLSFFIVSLLSFRGIIEFFEANQHSAIRSAVSFVTEPLVYPFYQLFPTSETAVSLATFAAMVTVCVVSAIGYILAGSLSRIEQVKNIKAQEDLPTFKHKKAA